MDVRVDWFHSKLEQSHRMTIDFRFASTHCWQNYRQLFHNVYYKRQSKRRKDRIKERMSNRQRQARRLSKEMLWIRPIGIFQSKIFSNIVRQVYVRNHLVSLRRDSCDNPRNISYEFFHLRYLLKVPMISRIQTLLPLHNRSSIEWHSN